MFKDGQFKLEKIEIDCWLLSENNNSVLGKKGITK